MKLTSLLAALLLTVTVSAQEFTGIDAFFGGPGYYDNLEEASAEPMEVLYLDLGMQVPKLTEIPIDVYKFPNLKVLDVSFNQIGSINIGISKLRNLESLNMNGNQYLNIVKGDISQLTNLTEINLKQSSLTAEQIADIESALPANCVVLH